MISILVYTAEPMAAEGLKTFLGRTGEFEVLVYDAMDALIARCAQDPQLDLVLLDATGINFQDIARVQLSLSKGRIILWARESSHTLNVRAIEMGARGVLQKTLPVEEQLACLRKVQAGGSCFDEATIQGFAGQQVTLTPLEADVMKLVSQGMKNRDIASTLMVSEGAVKKYLSRILQKLGIKDRLSLAALALTGFQPAIGDRRRRSRNNLRSMNKQK